MNSCVTLPLLSTFNEKGLKQYWNQQCQELQPKLWLPHKIELQGVDLDSFNGLLNYTEERLSHWKMILKPKVSTPQSLSVSLPHSAIPTTEKIKQQVASKKIRIYPKEKNKYTEALTLYRRAYNLAISPFIEGTFLDEKGKFKDLRPKIREKCKPEQEIKNAVYNTNIIGDAVKEAQTTMKKIMKQSKGKKNGFSKASFKSRKGDIHSFSIDRLSKSGKVAPKALGDIHITEEIPTEAIGKSCTVLYDKGRWFLIVQQLININTEIQGDVNVVAIDQGVRTFATCYSTSEVIIAGDKFTQNRLAPLMKKVDKLLSQKKRLLNLTLENEPQWYSDRMRYIEKKIAKLKCRKDDLIRDLHDRLAYELVSNYDVIFLPIFETKKMIMKRGDRKRKIRRVTAREMLDLNHYKFKLRIKWYAKKYRKHIVHCNESYTSKTYSWSGFIDNNLGSKKIIKDNGIIVDRDINGARGILLKQLTKVA